MSKESQRLRTELLTIRQPGLRLWIPSSSQLNNPDVTADELIASGRPGYSLETFEGSFKRKIERGNVSDLEVARQEGYEILFPDTKGGKSARQLAETGIPFSLGTALPCIVVGIIHEKVGIAGAHHLTVTAADTFAAYQRALREPLFLLQYRSTNALRQIYRLVAITEKYHQIVAKTTEEALEEFATLAAGDLPTTGIQVFSYGMWYTLPAELPSLNRTIRSTIANSPFMRKQRIPIANIGFTNWIKSAGELIYGGPTHSLYPNPTFLERGEGLVRR